MCKNNLKSLRRERSLSQSDLAKAASISLRHVQYLESGGRQFSIETATALAKALNCSPSDLLDPTMHQLDESSQHTVTIPFYAQQSHGAPVIFAEDPTQHPLTLSKAILRGSFGVKNFAELFALAATGRSMEPKIHEGDILICRKIHNSEDSICVIAHDEHIRVKRVVFVDKNQYRLVCCNPDYPPTTITVPQDDPNYFRILGKVLAVIHKVG